MTTPAMPTMPATPVAPTAVSSLLLDTGPGLDVSFASLIGAAIPDEGEAADIDELPPEAVALWLAGLVGAQAAVTATTAPAPVHKALTSATGSTRGVAVAGRAESATTAAEGLEEVLRDLLLPESTSDARAAGPERAAVILDAMPLKDALSWVPNSIDTPSTSRFPAHESTPKHMAPVQAQVGSPGWSDELAGRIAWIAREDLQSASIRLSPEHLGPLDVQVSVRDGDAIVSFAASHADTRAALEQALPKLRELLAAQGLTLAGANVSEHAPRHERSPQARLLRAAGEDAEPAREVGVRLPVGLVDTYA